jgi:transposase
MVFKERISAKKRAYAEFLCKEKGYSCRQIASKIRISKSSVSRILKEDHKKNTNNIRKKKKRGRRNLLSERDQRKLARSISQLRLESPNFSAMEVVQRSGISCTKAKYTTFLGYLKKLGYGFRQTRRKGVLTDRDYKKRLGYARKMQKMKSDFWIKDVAFYLDGVSFIYKRNPLGEALKPKNKLWRKKCEGLSITTKGSKDLPGGKRLHLLVAIAYGKGVISVEYEKMTGNYFSLYIKKIFPKLFCPISKLKNKMFVMDNDPCQNSAKAKASLKKLGVTMQPIPPRSPDLNPIENVFHVVRRQMCVHVKENRIEQESWDDFVTRIKQNIYSTPKDYIDKTIASMPKRIKNVIENKGRRIKY